MTQEEIFYAIQNSTKLENKAIEQLFKFYNQAKAIVLRHKLSVEDAENTFQDAVIELTYRIKDIKNLKNIKNKSFVIQGEDSMKRFLLKYVKNKSLSMARRQAKLVNELPEYLMAETNDLPSIQEEELISKIFELAARSKNGKLIGLKYFENMSYTEIETALNYAKNSPKNAIYRLFENIRNQIRFEDYLVK